MEKSSIMVNMGYIRAKDSEFMLCARFKTSWRDWNLSNFCCNCIIYELRYPYATNQTRNLG